MSLYWPLSIIAKSPLLHHTQTWQLMCAYNQAHLPEATLVACNQVAAGLQPVEMPLVVVQSVDTPMRRVYTDYPTPEAFEALERGGFHATSDTFGFVVDALH